MPEPLASALLALPDRYNIGARQPAAVTYVDDIHGDRALRVGEFVWGLVPKWSKEPQTKYTTVTARLERAPRSRIFRGPWEQRRCVIPMNGYYKWDRSAKPAVPYFIQARDGRALFAAGLWERWERDDLSLLSFAVLTHPNPAIPAPLVPDGPVFLPHAQWSRWATDAPWFPMRYLTTMKQPELEAYRVSRAIRNPALDDYTLLEPADAGAPDDPVDDGDADDWDEDED
ncbi:SOS response-associated peptidase [Cognatilysobacter tabacisoli]|uniref:SOS response-associated peptidase n=1 Tax=Cognatilysobacter tabacisoli TaxID=2315424 RepID=UPI000E6B2C07|nr:SOS response-associated peptidase family protein [Lysobacter tabacisoli]